MNSVAMLGEPKRVCACAAGKIQDAGTLGEQRGHVGIDLLSHPPQVGVVFDELVVFIRVAVVGFRDGLERTADNRVCHVAPDTVFILKVLS